MPRMSLDVELRGQAVSIDLNALAPEYDVGILGWGFEDEVMTDGEGKELQWELTEEELDKICSAVSNAAWDGYFNDDFD